MRQGGRVTICVPVYNGQAFVGETLAAIQSQSHEDLTVLISDDASSDESAEICRTFASDSRFRVAVQPSRLGWVENCNRLLRQANSELVCIVSHDDLLETHHIKRLVECFAAEPQCALAFSDIRVFGMLDHVEHQESISGPAAERVRAFVASHFDGTAFHGLIRRDAIEVAGGLRSNHMNDFAADVSWLGRLASAGDFRRVAEPLYRKRRIATSVSLQWDWSDDMRAAAWSMHCRELLRDGLSRPLTESDEWLLVRAVLRRLLAIEPPGPFTFIRDFPHARQMAMVETVLDGLVGARVRFRPDLLS